MNIVEFINQVLIEEIRQIQQQEKHTYLSFGLISQGIELLGSLIDEHEINLDRSGESANRFNAALIEFFGSDYSSYANKTDDFNLFKNLRCGMLHIVIPTNKLALGERKHDYNKHKHLEKYRDHAGNERLFLTAEDFYEDFRCACKKVIDIISDKSIFTKYQKLGIASTVKKEIIELKRDFLNTSLLLA